MRSLRHAGSQANGNLETRFFPSEQIISVKVHSDYNETEGKMWDIQYLSWFTTCRLEQPFKMLSFLISSASFWFFNGPSSASFWLFKGPSSASFWLFNGLSSASFWLFKGPSSASFWLFNGPSSASFWLFNGPSLASFYYLIGHPRPFWLFYGPPRPPIRLFVFLTE